MGIEFITIIIIFSAGLPNSTPRRFAPGKYDLGTHYIKGWTKSKAGLHSLEKERISYFCLSSQYPGQYAD
jgi:hypothetical protein